MLGFYAPVGPGRSIGPGIIFSGCSTLCDATVHGHKKDIKIGACLVEINEKLDANANFSYHYPMPLNKWINHGMSLPAETLHRGTTPP